MILWNEEKYSIGNAELDGQHRKILEVIMEVVELHQGSACDETEVLSVLLELNQYAADHFAVEERKIESHAPDLLALQEESHRRYSEQIARFMLESGKLQSNLSRLLEFLLDWWENHILHEDMQYKGRL